ncbi:MAG: helix-turn-helix transcriptional regulator [Lachnospiraceae bacterium]|nr:helix-turn-helix transcriptional regulator [Lachnospiraceae bacterium]
MREHSNDLVLIARNINSARLQQDITPVVLEEKCGVTMSTIYRIERNEQEISLKTLLSLAVALNMTPEEVFKGTSLDVNNQDISIFKK